MGGSLKQGYVIIGGVVAEEIRGYYDGLVKAGKFASRSQAVGHVLTEYAKKHGVESQEENDDA